MLLSKQHGDVVAGNVSANVLAIIMAIVARRNSIGICEVPSFPEDGKRIMSIVMVMAH